MNDLTHITLSIEGNHIATVKVSPKRTLVERTCRAVQEHFDANEVAFNCSPETARKALLNAYASNPIDVDFAINYDDDEHISTGEVQQTWIY